MQRASQLVLSIITCMLTGYVIGLSTGFTAFDPDTDMYALLSLVFALIGVIVGIIPFFRERVYIIFGMLIGFYIGMLISIVIWGNSQTDDLLEFLKRGGLSIIVTLAVSILGGFLASHINFTDFYLSALAFLLGGFLGGALFVALNIAPFSSMVGVSPYVIGSGIVCAFSIRFVQRRFQT